MPDGAIQRMPPQEEADRFLAHPVACPDGWMETLGKTSFTKMTLLGGLGSFCVPRPREGCSRGRVHRLRKHK